MVPCSWFHKLSYRSVVSHRAAWFHPHSYTNAPSKLVGLMRLVAGAESLRMEVLFLSVLFLSGWVKTDVMPSDSAWPNTRQRPSLECPHLTVTWVVALHHQQVFFSNFLLLFSLLHASFMIKTIFIWHKFMQIPVVISIISWIWREREWLFLWIVFNFEVDTIYFSFIYFNVFNRGECRQEKGTNVDANLFCAFKGQFAHFYATVWQCQEEQPCAKT